MDTRDVLVKNFIKVNYWNICRYRSLKSYPESTTILTIIRENLKFGEYEILHIRYLGKFIIMVRVFYSCLMIVFPIFLGSWIFRNRINVLPGEFFVHIFKTANYFSFDMERMWKFMEKSGIFESQRNDLYCVIFLLLLTCIWKVLDEFCPPEYLWNGCGIKWLWLHFPICHSKFCRKLQCSQIVEFLFFNYLHACVEKITDHFR